MNDKDFIQAINQMMEDEFPNRIGVVDVATYRIIEMLWDLGGEDAIRAYARKSHPEWGWNDCFNCEKEQPIWIAEVEDGDLMPFCAVCYFVVDLLPS